MLKREDIRIRDPFILVDYENKCYYMYGSTEIGTNKQATFSVYKSLDLENFEQPITVLMEIKAIFGLKSIIGMRCLLLTLMDNEKLHFTLLMK